MTNLEDQDFSKNILSKIKEKKLLPKPRWRFLLKNIIVWGLGIFSLVLGALSTSLVFYILTNEDPGINRDGNPLQALFFVIPFFWIICLGVFAVAVYFYIKHTKNGYKYSTKQIIGVIFAASLVLGAVLNLLGASRVIDDTLGESAPLYDRVLNPQLSYWSSPEQGRLTGLVVSQADTDAYYLVDRSKNVWVIMLADSKDSRKISLKHPVRLIGHMVGNNGFVVKEILPVGPGRGFFRRPLPPGIPEPCEADQTGSAGHCQIIFTQPN